MIYRWVQPVHQFNHLCSWVPTHEHIYFSKLGKSWKMFPRPDGDLGGFLEFFPGFLKMRRRFLKYSCKKSRWISWVPTYEQIYLSKSGLDWEAPTQFKKFFCIRTLILVLWNRSINQGFTDGLHGRTSRTDGPALSVKKSHHCRRPWPYFTLILTFPSHGSLN